MTARDTEHPGAKRRTPERAEELDDLLENLNEALHQVGPDGTILWANRAELEMLGYARAEYVGRNIVDFHVDQDVAADFLAHLVAGDTLRDRPARLRCRDGSIKHVQVSSSGRFVDGKFASSRCITRDVSREQQARVAQERLAAIVASSDDAILSKDLFGIINSWNPAAERLLGYTAQEMVGESILKIIPPELQREEAEILASIRSGRPVDHFETVRMAKGGKRIFVSISVSPLKDVTGRVIGASKILRDVTGQREGARALSVLAAIVHSSDDAIISKDLNGTIVSWNPAAEKMYGYSAAEMVGERILKIIPPELQDEEDVLLAKIRLGERIRHYETVRLRKDGTRVEVSLTVSPVIDASGKVVGASKIARDISPQREAQRTKDQFLAVLAHELRNPLAPIRNALELIRGGKVPADRLDRVVDIAERQMAQMTRLLDDLLDVSRLSTGRVKLHRQRVDLSQLAHEAAETVRPAMDARGLTFTHSIPETPLWLDADPVRVLQILNNLLSNAYKYTDSGGKVHLGVEASGGWSQVTVRDTGIGFSPRMRDRMFTLFAQDEGAAKRAAGGLGIGLALVRDFAERHGGSATAHSDGPNRGAEFVVRLPLDLRPH